MIMDKTGKKGMSRRKFIVLSTLGGGALTLGLYLGFGGEKNKNGREVWGGADGFKPNAWLRIDKEGLVTVRIKHCEMGQGTATGLSAIVADELEMPWDRVRFEIAPVESVYKNPAFNVQATGGSTATPYSWDPLRRAGAAAREMLIAAAAAKWKAPASKCRAEAGKVVHKPTGRTLEYTDLLERAAKIKPPQDPPLKNPSQYKLIGKNMPRLDTRDKVMGKAVYGQDVVLPGMVTAYIIHPQPLGAELAGFEGSEAEKMPGVVKVLPIRAGLAVVAKTYWQAAQAADKVKPRWTGGLQGFSSESLWDQWRSMAKEKEAEELYALGEAKDAFDRADKVIEAEYKVPWQAHATPEPMNCTAHVEKDRCRIWAPTQNQDACQEVGAYMCGLSYNQVEVVTPYLGGGFGRRGMVDYAAEAVELSKALGLPVKVMWSREEDLANDFFRPAGLNLLRAGLDKKGNLISWHHRIVGPDQFPWMIPDMITSAVPYWVPRGVRNIAGWAGRSIVGPRTAGQGVVSGAGPLYYQVPNVLVDYVHHDPGVPCGSWRSVGNSANAFVIECFMDELAQTMGLDPLEWRRRIMKDNPRLAKVVELVEDRKTYSQGLDQEYFSGLAAHVFHGAPVAMRAEVSVRGGAIKVNRVVAAVDCGRIINPNIVRDQISGAVAFGLSATLNSEITIEDGRVVQTNFDDFPYVTMAEMPQVEVLLVDSDQPPLGIGEVGVPPVAPAVANAVSRAVGKRIRSLPIRL